MGFYSGPTNFFSVSQKDTPAEGPIGLVMEKEFTEYVPIIETHNAGDRVFIKSILDAEGIVYFIQGEQVAPYLFNALPMRVMVKKDQAEKARKLVKGIELAYSYGFRGNSEDPSNKGGK